MRKDEVPYESRGYGSTLGCAQESCISKRSIVSGVGLRMFVATNRISAYWSGRYSSNKESSTVELIPTETVHTDGTMGQTLRAMKAMQTYIGNMLIPQGTPPVVAMVLNIMEEININASREIIGDLSSRVSLEKLEFPGPTSAQKT